MITLTREHEMFRKLVKDFVDKELRPHVLQWEQQGFTDRSVWKKSGQLGLLGIPYDPAFGGLGLDYTYSMIAADELSQCGSLGVALGLAVQADMATPALAKYGNDFLKSTYLAAAISGDQICAIAVTEPHSGSDVASLKTFAQPRGGDYIINGTKMFITNGSQADFLVVLARTSTDPGHRCFSLFVVPTSLSGVGRGRILKKTCYPSSDTAEIVLDHVVISKDHLIGQENLGFIYQMEQFQWERLTGSIQVLGALKRCYDLTKQYVRSRKAFGSVLGEMPVIRHRLAQVIAEIKMFEAFCFQCVTVAIAGQDFSQDVSMLKLLAAQLQLRAFDEFVQIHGGYGLMTEYEVARYFRDSKLIAIGGGSSEIMKEIIAKSEKYDAP